ncbi:PilZ domain-containing protein [Pseudomonas corrugata]|uniref:PilZ domain-containing protein n=1 Tax=Pseudomonas corrugata TaxID=47879 RepID=UPI0022343290|nr:PilZ domain-containing protein [Pseudomonas corrugata]MDU9038286.1 PilZ domain-containing protein [Pseudomonas corrugata]UZE05182.1 PilZ domain-containing protein [Pseudomonas corrugata]
MYKKRRIDRQDLPCFLKVFNGVNDRLIGYLGNVSEHGLMLISTLPLMVGADFELHLKIPAADEGPQRNIKLKATCLWCHEDVTPQHFDAGFSLHGAPPEYGQLVSALQQYFSFHSLPASA